MAMGKHVAGGDAEHYFLQQPVINYRFLLERSCVTCKYDRVGAWIQLYAVID